MAPRHEQRPLDLSDHRPVVAPVYVIVLIMAASISWGMAYKSLLNSDESMAKNQQDYAVRLKLAEDKVAVLPEIQKDIGWLIKLEEARERREGRDPNAIPRSVP